MLGAAEGYRPSNTFAATRANVSTIYFLLGAFIQCLGGCLYKSLVFKVIVRPSTSRSSG